MPNALTSAIYVASYADFTLGAFDTVHRRRIGPWLTRAADAIDHCDNDPLCSQTSTHRPHAACDRCLHLTFGCRTWNADLDRKLLRRFWLWTRRRTRRTVTGLVGLVPLAELLADISGSRQGAVHLATEIFHQGMRALPRGQRQRSIYATRRQLAAAGVITEHGVPVLHRAAELVVVCEVLAASALPSAAQPPEPRLVLSAPVGTAPIADVERLDSLVLDVIRRATDTLHLGGAFWNDEGFERLDEVLIPALTVRGVTAVVYANSPTEPRRRRALEERLDRLVATGQAALRWFDGPRPTMLHAKFVIADRRLGYLGTANLTSWGLQGHIEAGVQLTSGQAERFAMFLQQLEAAGLFVAAPRE